MTMTAEKAKKIADKTIEENKQQKEAFLLDKAERLSKSVDKDIKIAAKNGKFEIPYNLDYEGQKNKEDTIKIANFLQNIFNKRGFITDLAVYQHSQSIELKLNWESGGH